MMTLLAGCYAPELRDCAVTCGGDDTCADGQTCIKGFCAAEGVSCTESPPAMVTDAAIAADAPERVIVRVKISNTGKVEIPGAGTCGSNGDNDCSIPVVRGTVTATAVPTKADHPFERWESGNCKDQPATCTFSATGPTTIEVKFR